MININYKYRNKQGSIKFALEEKIRDACAKVAMQLDIDIDTIVVILNEEKLNAKSKKTFEDIQNSYNLNKNVIEMLFFDDPDKIVKVIVNYEGNVTEIKAKKDEDSLFKIFGKMKLNIEKMFFVGGGEAIQEKDLKKSIKELNNMDNEEGELNFLAYDVDEDDDNAEKMEDNKKEDINNDKTNNNNIDNSNSNEQISNNNLNEKLLDVNNSNDKILNVNNSNDKILNVGGPNDKILDVKGDKEKKEKKIRNVSVVSNKHFLTKTFLVLKIEFFLIMGLTWLGCYFNINEAFIKSKGAMLGTFIPSLILLLILSFYVYALIFDKDNPNKLGQNKLGFIICFIAYILCITFFCFLLTNFTQNKYTMMVLFLIIVDYLLLEIYHSFILTNEYFLLTFVPLIIANAILIVMYSFIWIEGTRVIVNISIISFSAILYIIIVNYVMRTYEEEEYLFGVYTFNYGVFLPATFITLFTILLLLVIIISCFNKGKDKDKKNDKGKDNDNKESDKDKDNKDNDKNNDKDKVKDNNNDNDKIIKNN